MLSAKYTNRPNMGARHGLSVAEGSSPSSGRTDAVAEEFAQRSKVNSVNPPSSKTIRFLMDTDHRVAASTAMLTGR